MATNKNGKGKSEFIQRAGTIFAYENKNKRGDNSPDFQGTLILELPEDFEVEEFERLDEDEETITVQGVKAHVMLWNGESKNGEMLSGRVQEQGEFEAALEAYNAEQGESSSFDFGKNKKSGRGGGSGKASRAAANHSNRGGSRKSTKTKKR